MKSLLFIVLLVCAGAARAAAADVNIDQVGQKFDPKSVTIKVGDTLKFHNSDDVTHNIQITDADGNNEDAGLQKPGQDIAQTIDKAGTYSVHCAIHPRMKMTVEVK